MIINNVYVCITHNVINNIYKLINVQDLLKISLCYLVLFDIIMDEYIYIYIYVYKTLMYIYIYKILIYLKDIYIFYM